MTRRGSMDRHANGGGVMVVTLITMTLVGIQMGFPAQSFSYSETTTSNQREISPEYPFNLSLAQIMDIPIVSATRREEKWLTAPATISVVTAETFKEKGFFTVLDVLKTIPGWEFEECHGGWVGQYPRLRGIRSLRQILLLIDGVVQNNINDAEMGRYHTFELHSVNRIEIITGPGSALYGANALLGVINIITKQPNEIDGVEVVTRYTTSIGRESFAFDKYAVNLLAGQTLENGFEYLFSFDYIDSNDQGRDFYDPEHNYQKGYEKSGEIIYSDDFNNTQKDYTFKMRLGKDNLGTFGLDYADIDEGIGSMLNGGNYRNDNNRWHTRRISAFAGLDLKPFSTLKLAPNWYYRSDQIVNDTFFAFNYDREVDETLYPAGTPAYYKQQAFKTGGELLADWTPLNHFSLLSGILYEKIQTTNERRRYNRQMSNYSTLWYDQGEPYNDFVLPIQIHQEMVFAHLFSFYFQSIFELAETFKFIAGGRYDKESEISGKFHPRSGIIYDNNATRNRLVMKILYGEAYRGLPHYQKHMHGHLATMEDIRPEEAATYEFILHYLPTDAFKFDLTGWFNNLENLYLDGVTAVSSKTRDDDGYPNNDYVDAKLHGIQLDFKTKLSNLILEFNYAYTGGEYLDLYFRDQSREYTIQNGDLFRVAEHKANASFGYQLQDIATASVRLKYVGPRTVSPANYRYAEDVIYTYDNPSENPVTRTGNGEMQGYLIWNLAVQALNLGKVTGLLDGFSIGLSIDNLFDRKFLEPGRSNSKIAPYYHPQPGRRVTCLLGYRKQF